MSTYRSRTGITQDEYDRLLKAQGGVCAICGNPPKTRRLDVDHDHRTKKVRGLLCHRCNRALPSWVDTSWLLAAADYLSDEPRMTREQLQAFVCNLTDPSSKWALRTEPSSAQKWREAVERKML